MSSPAEATLEAGFDALNAYHGERLTWRSGSVILQSGTGEVITTEAGKAIESGDPDGEEIEFIGIFDDQYQLETLSGAGILTTIDAVSVKTTILPDVARGDMIVRGATTYYVNDVQADGMGTTRLILSKHAH